MNTYIEYQREFMFALQDSMPICGDLRPFSSSASSSTERSGSRCRLQSLPRSRPLSGGSIQTTTNVHIEVHIHHLENNYQISKPISSVVDDNTLLLDA